MCGIAGLLDFQRRRRPTELEALVGRMRDELTHRGPDDSGTWTDASAGIALGHRRLSIVDLSSTGHQPMVSASGRYVIAFNGEIYNFAELRDLLEARGATFRGRSDTEVILASVEEWGVPAALERFNGMFAIALWDRAEQALYLARDRFGEKPLYYATVGDSVVFASELKALTVVQSFDSTIDRQALAHLVRFSAIPAPWTIYEAAKKLEPASWLCIRAREDVRRPTTAYWSAQRVAAAGVESRRPMPLAEAVDVTDAALRTSIRLRMVADVPLGAFLSGGIDSSVVVSLMQAQSSRRVRTFTIGFRESGFDEAAFAKRVASHLGTEHTELYVAPEDALSVIPRLPRMYDEPFADSSQIPTYLVSALARQHVTVALSGDGGDELFGGYDRYGWTKRIWRLLRSVPARLRAPVARTLTSASPSQWDALFAKLTPASLRQGNNRISGERMHRLAELLSIHDRKELYSHVLSSSAVADGLLRWPEETPLPPLGDSFAEYTDAMMATDTLRYLPDDILVKVDRAAMAVSLETRVPMLDPDVYELAWKLPRNALTNSRQGKVVLREILARYVPRPLFERPKMGFGVPIERWLRGPLRDWAEDLLRSETLEAEGHFQADAVRRLWTEHVSGRRNWHYALWPVLMFQAWHRERRHYTERDEAAAVAAS